MQVKCKFADYGAIPLATTIFSGTTLLLGQTDVAAYSVAASEVISILGDRQWQGTVNAVLDFGLISVAKLREFAKIPPPEKTFCESCRKYY
jgi:hypothetical protein